TDWWSVSSFAAAAVVAGAVMWVVGQLTDVLLLALGAGAVAYVTAAGTLGGPALARARVALRPERVRPLVGGDVS
ncbi:MAG: hypothetical protein OES57_18955, partial [Acidimicrobiia bacterium]|nr:hypothetical protein [Acidimicrobiia bacterium]